MMLFDGEQHLERLLQKSLRYEHHQKNYKMSYQETGTKITKNEKKYRHFNQ